MPKLTIDGQQIEVEPGTTVIRAADRLGIYVPHYCWHPGLTVAGNCRMCLVDVEKAPKLSIACSTAVAEGMVVRTTGPKVKEARDAILEFLLINHPLDCPICDEAGECRLQEYAFRYGPARSRFLEEKVHKPKRVDLGKHIVFDAERCILCTRCVRFCQEVTKTNELTTSNRGDHVTIETFPGQRLDNLYSGNTVDICPVGALTLKEFRFRQRVWFLKDIHSVCAGCARGCSVINGISKGQIQRITPRTNPEVNRWWICDEGRLSHLGLVQEARIEWARLAGRHAIRPIPEEEFAAARRGEPAAARRGDTDGSVGATLGSSASPEEAVSASPPSAEAASAASAKESSQRSASRSPLEESLDDALPLIPMANEGVSPAPKTRPQRPGETAVALALDAAARTLDAARKDGGPGSVEIVLSSRALNEDLFVMGKLARELGAVRVALPVHERGENDDLLLRQDKTPNRRGALAILAALGLTVESLATLIYRVRSGAARAVVAVGPNLMGLESPRRAAVSPRTGGGGAGPPESPAAWAAAVGDDALFEDLAAAAESAGATLIAIDAFESPMTTRAPIVIPALPYGEIEGTVTNFEGHVQRVRAGLAPGSDGLPVYRIAQEITRRLGGTTGRAGAQETFSALAAEIPAFSGLTYARLADNGARFAGAESTR